MRVDRFLVGLIVGILIATALPAQGHHARSYRRLRNRVSSLEYKVSVLQNKTTKLNSLGRYTGTVYGYQISVPGGCLGDPAVWTFASLNC